MKLNIGFSQFSDTGLADKAEAVIKALTGNAPFPTPNPALATISALTKALRDAIASSGAGRTEAIAAARAALTAALVALAANLIATEGVTEADLATTGFDLPAARTRTSAPPEAPTNVRLKPGTKSCTIVPRCDAVTSGGVRVYEAEWTLDPNNGSWNNGGSFPSSRAMELNGLPRAKDVWVRVRVQGTNGHQWAPMGPARGAIPRRSW